MSSRSSFRTPDLNADASDCDVGCCPVRVSERQRKCLIIALMMCCSVATFGTLLQFLVGLLPMIFCSELLRFIDALVLPIIMIVAGVTAFPFTVRVAWLGAKYRISGNVFKNRKLRSAACYTVVMLSATVVVNLIGACVVIYMLIYYHSEKDIHKHVCYAMESYSNNFVAKVNFDSIQWLLQCCGAQSLEDWFELDWESSDLEPDDNSTVQAMRDNVPYSCCNRTSSQICNHYNVALVGTDSLSQTGCTQALKHILSSFINMTITLCLLEGLFQLWLIVILAILQAAFGAPLPFLCSKLCKKSKGDPCTESLLPPRTLISSESLASTSSSWPHNSAVDDGKDNMSDSEWEAPNTDNICCNTHSPACMKPSNHSEHRLPE